MTGGARLSALILALVVATALLRVEFLFYLVYFCIGLYVWGRWITPWSLRRLSVWREFADHAFLGEEVAVRIHVRNRSRLPLPWLEVVESTAIDLRAREATNDVLALGGHEAAWFDYTVRATRRGQYRIGPLYLSSGDLFGFFHEQRRRHDDRRHSQCLSVRCRPAQDLHHPNLNTLTAASAVAATQPPMTARSGQVSQIGALSMATSRSADSMGVSGNARDS